MWWTWCSSHSVVKEYTPTSLPPHILILLSTLTQSNLELPLEALPEDKIDPTQSEGHVYGAYTLNKEALTEFTCSIPFLVEILLPSSYG